MALAVMALCLCVSARSMAQSFTPPARTKTFGQAWNVIVDAAEKNTPINGGILNLKASCATESLFAGRLTASSSSVSSSAEVSSNDELNGEGKLRSKSKSPEGSIQPLPDHSLDNHQDLQPADPQGGFEWNKAITQMTLFAGIMHGFRFATEPGTRAELRGPFFKDYFRSVKNLRGWGDGDEFLVNYIGHPMQGAVSGYIQIQNDPKGINLELDLRNKQYWKSRMKAMAWAAVWSTQFELGPISEASLGNVGLKPSKKSQHPMAYVDLVVTPVFGVAWLVGEDLLDRYVIRFIESKIKYRPLRILARSFLNPTRSFANMHRGKLFWHRDDRP
jgi:hypothetical protein